MASPRKPVQWADISPQRRKDLSSIGWEEATWDQDQSPKKTQAAQAKEELVHDFEFGGPINVIFMMVGLPIGVWGLFLGCNELSRDEFGAGGCPALQVPDFSKYTFYSHEAMAVLLLWVGWLVALWAIVPGTWVDGAVLPGTRNTRLQYKLNGFASMLVTYALLAMAQYQGWNGFRLAWLHDHQLELATATIMFSAVLSVLLYWKARTTDCIKAAPGNTGVVHYDFFMGNELNPRIGRFDLKVFFELRPGLIGWTVLNAAMAAKQYETTGEVSLAMLLINLFQLVYVVDALYFERAILTTMDITTDGFGYMLVFGDMAWVPFTYGLQARYLVIYPTTLSTIHLVAVFATVAVGYYVFRGANGQKNTFRNDPEDPSVRHLKTLQTKRGTRLIVDGWWGTSRHINYFGDWIMAWSWCLPCGFAHPIPYFYVVYFAGLLIHRERRDDHGCRIKYGKDWDKYCEMVQYRIIPFVY